jgi:hypothetical protein
MRRRKMAMVARRGDAPAKNGDGITARGCAGEKWRWDAPAYIGDGGAARGCASQMDQHQIGGLAANAPANEETKMAGNAPAKWNNTKLVGSVGNAPAK